MTLAEELQDLAVRLAAGRKIVSKLDGIVNELGALAARCEGKVLVQPSVYPRYQAAAASPERPYFHVCPLVGYGAQIAERAAEGPDKQTAVIRLQALLDKEDEQRD